MRFSGSRSGFAIAATLTADGFDDRCRRVHRPRLIPARDSLTSGADQQLASADDFAPEHEVTHDRAVGPIGVAQEHDVLCIQRELRQLGDGDPRAFRRRAARYLQGNVRINGSAEKRRRVGEHIFGSRTAAVVVRELNVAQLPDEDGGRLRQHLFRAVGRRRRNLRVAGGNRRFDQRLAFGLYDVLILMTWAASSCADYAQGDCQGAANRGVHAVPLARRRCAARWGSAWEWADGASLGLLATTCVSDS